MNKIKNKILLLLIIILIYTVMTGCWDNVELRNRNLISAIGVDKATEKGKIVLTLQIVLPDKLSTPSKQINTRNSAVRTVSITGDSITDTIRSYRTQSNTIPLFQHCRILVLGEEIAKDGIESIMNFFTKSIYIKPHMQVWVCPGKASDVINWESEDIKIPANHINDLVKTRSRTSSNFYSDIHGFLVLLSEKTTSAATGKIELVKQENNKSTVPDIRGMAVFKQGKLVGWLDLFEERGFLWITNKLNNALVLVGYPQNDSPKITLDIKKSKSTLKSEINDGKIIFSLEVKAEGSINENNTLLDLNSQEVIFDIERLMENAIKKDIDTCLEKVQKEYSSDIFGFGEVIHRKYPKEWKNIEDEWEQIFTDVPVIVKVTAKIKGEGISSNSILQ